MSSSITIRLPLAVPPHFVVLERNFDSRAVFIDAHGMDQHHIFVPAHRQIQCHGEIIVALITRSQCHIRHSLP